MKTDDMQAVMIRKDVLNEIERQVSRSIRFDSASEFINFVLSELLFGTSAEVSEESKRVIAQRMKDLGYL